MTVRRLLDLSIQNAQTRFDMMELSLQTASPREKPDINLQTQRAHAALNALLDLRTELITRGLL